MHCAIFTRVPEKYLATSMSEDVGQAPYWTYWTLSEYSYIE